MPVGGYDETGLKQFGQTPEEFDRIGKGGPDFRNKKGKARFPPLGQVEYILLRTDHGPGTLEFRPGKNSVEFRRGIPVMVAKNLVKKGPYAEFQEE